MLWKERKEGGEEGRRERRKEGRKGGGKKSQLSIEVNLQRLLL